MHCVKKFDIIAEHEGMNERCSRHIDMLVTFVKMCELMGLTYVIIDSLIFWRKSDLVKENLPAK